VRDMAQENGALALQIIAYYEGDSHGSSIF
jgi:hypothetical protein